jgi:predicted unusual protein kinase regulating ubiquinone biosynthesis (AarF/ABC1/UbiB family)
VADKEKKKLGKIREGALSRTFALARMTAQAGVKAAGGAVGTLLAGSAEERAERVKKLALEQAELLTRELGRLKGSVMKVGQMVGLIGEHLLPPEAVRVLRMLNQESPPLAWPQIEKVLQSELGPEKLAELEIDRESYASASLGQVHRARIRADGTQVAIKIQYPGVDRAIGSDLKALRTALSVARLLPTGAGVDAIFDEIRTMLEQEVDYEIEAQSTHRFRDLLQGDPRFIVPQIYSRYSTKRILTTSFEPGLAVDGPEVAALPLERRTNLARNYMDLYYRELFVWHQVQTDPHFGNYRIRLGEGGSPDRWVLFDFGAVRRIPETFLASYRWMVWGAVHQNREALLKGAIGIGVLAAEDPPEIQEAFVSLTFLMTEPFHHGVYDWGNTDLVKRVMKQGGTLILTMKTQLRVPPRELVFLDRKLGGVFMTMNALRAQFDGNEVLDRYLPRPSDA